MNSKLTSLANKEINQKVFEGDFKCLNSFEIGFKEAFKLIDENLLKELQNLEKHIFHGERIMTLKLYKKKIQSYLEEMELPYE